MTETHDKRTETHTCDCISRQAAIDAVHEEFDECLVWDESGQRTADEFEIIINRLPSAQQWIPCKERLPKPEEEVLLTFDYKKRRYVETGNIWSDGTTHCYTDDYLTPDGRKYRKVVAWMPLPEPYKEGEK